VELVTGRWVGQGRPRQNQKKKGKNEITSEKNPQTSQNNVQQTSGFKKTCAQFHIHRKKITFSFLLAESWNLQHYLSYHPFLWEARACLSIPDQVQLQG